MPRSEGTTSSPARVILSAPPVREDAAGGAWLILMAIFGVGFLVTRRRNAKFARRLQAAGFQPTTDETGRLRYLPPGLQIPGQANPIVNGPYGAAQPLPYGYPQPQQQAYGQPAQAPGPYAPQQPYPQQNPTWQSPQR